MIFIGISYLGIYPKGNKKKKSVKFIYDKKDGKNICVLSFQQYKLNQW